MLKIKGGGGGGASKSASRGVGKDVVTRSEALHTEAEHLVVLRAVLRDDDGNDRNVLVDFPSFTHFERNGLAADISFAVPPLSREELRFAMDLTKRNMELTYESSGYGWVSSEKRNELRDDSARILLVRRAPARAAGASTGTGAAKTTAVTPPPPPAGAGAGAGADASAAAATTAAASDDATVGDLIGFVNLRFTVQGELYGESSGPTTTMVYDIQLVEEAQRKGLGKHLMALVELISRKWRISSVTVPLIRGTETREFFTDTLKGYRADDDMGEGDDQQEVLVKKLAVPRAAAVSAADAAAAQKLIDEVTKGAAALAAMKGGDASVTKAAAPTTPPRDAAAAASGAGAGAGEAASPDTVTAPLGSTSADGTGGDAPLTKAQKKRLRKKKAKAAAASGGAADADADAAVADGVTA